MDVNLQKKVLKALSMGIRSLVAYIIIVCAGLICLIPIVINLFLPARYRYANRIYFFFLDFFYNAVLYSLCVPIRIVGKENIPEKKSRPVIFIGNHQSSLDIPVMGYVCHGHAHVWLILEYYANHPIIGPMVRRMNITVDRDNSIKAARSLIKVIRFLENYNSHLIIFPEGRRYVDGKIHQFFEGFAIIARKTQRPVIPVYMKSNYKIFAPNRIFVRFAPLDIIIGKPFMYNSTDTDELFTERVRNWFIAQEK